MTQNIPTPQADGRAARPALDAGIQAGQFAPTAIATYRQDWCAYTAWWEAVGAAALDPARRAQWRAHLAGETTHITHSILHPLQNLSLLLASGTTVPLANNRLT
jgi:hypothetical protein